MAKRIEGYYEGWVEVRTQDDDKRYGRDTISLTMPDRNEGDAIVLMSTTEALQLASVLLDTVRGIQLEQG